MSKRGNGEGTIVKRKDGTWAAALRLDDSKRKWVYGKTRKEAQAKLDEARAARQQGRIVAHSNQSVARFLNDWLRDVAQLTVKPTTFDSYALNVRRVTPHIGHIKLDQLKGAHIDMCYRALLDGGLSRSSVNQAHRVLRVALRYAVRTDLLISVPTAKATAPRAERREMKTLSAEQAATLFESSTGERMHSLWVLLVTTGLRIGEATALQWKEVDLDAGTLQIRHTLQRRKGAGMVLRDVKTVYSRRTVHLAPSTVIALRLHRDRQVLERRRAANLWTEGDFVFATEVGLPLDPRYVRDALIRALKRAHLPQIRVHDLRHTCASILLTQGTHPKIVQELLGHSSITVTMDIYSHLLPSLHLVAASHMDALFGGGAASSGAS